MLADDDQTASDHLPVIMYFNNPFSPPFGLLALNGTNQDVRLIWEGYVSVFPSLATWSVRSAGQLVEAPFTNLASLAFR